MKGNPQLHGGFCHQSIHAHQEQHLYIMHNISCTHTHNSIEFYSKHAAVPLLGPPALTSQQPNGSYLNNKPPEAAGPRPQVAQLW